MIAAVATVCDDPTAVTGVPSIAPVTPVTRSTQISVVRLVLGVAVIVSDVASAVPTTQTYAVVVVAGAVA